MGVMSVLSPFAILRQLRVGKEASTLVRLGRSRHVADLRLIFSVTLIIMVISAALAVAFCFEHQIISNWKDVHDRPNNWVLVRLALAAIADSGAFIGAVGAVGCGVLAWTYQSGSARLGVVDLFACEIATLCRVFAVADTVRRYVDLFEHGPRASAPHPIDGELPADTSRFTSQESYFPVFDASVKELQALEADSVKHVTAFYTYMKVMRDSLRRLAEIRPPEGSALGSALDTAPCDDDWHRAICSVVYMQFLGLESARKAVQELVEYEPTQAEDVITILLSELLAYGFLRQQFRGDLRQRRLEARDETYRRDIPALYRLVMAGTGPEWDAPKDLAAEMMNRFDLVLADTPTQRAVRAAAMNAGIGIVVTARGSAVRV
jgi:hypothetical protein